MRNWKKGQEPKSEEIIVELPADTLDSSIAPLQDATHISPSALMAMASKRDTPFPCYKRMQGGDHVTVRITLA